MKHISMFATLMCMMLLAGCSSKEEKAAELIKDELSKTLYDYDSYQPIETTVKEAHLNIYNDSVCWRKGAVLAYEMQQAMKYIKEADDAKERMDIWGPPTYYSSSYSDNKYYKYKDEYAEALGKVVETGNICKTLAAEIRDYAEKLDTAQVIGWEVSHRFRCKTRGGNSAIGDYRYVISKDFKAVLLREDTDSDDDKQTRTALGTIMTDYWDSWD